MDSYRLEKVSNANKNRAFRMIEGLVIVIQVRYHFEADAESDITIEETQRKIHVLLIKWSGQ